MYDRTFILNGPIVKVYKNAEDSIVGERTYQKLDHQMDFPVIKNYDNETIRPRNLMLHENEGKLVFLDEKKNDTVYVFDLEKGKISD